MNSGSDTSLGSDRSLEEAEFMSSSACNPLSNDENHLSSTSRPHKTNARTTTNSGTSSRANSGSSSKSRYGANTNSQRRASSLVSSSRTLKRKPSLNVDLERDWKNDIHDDSILDDWFDSDRPISNEPLASTSTTASTSTSLPSSKFRPKRARPSTPPIDVSKSETESEDDKPSTHPSYHSISPNHSRQDRSQIRTFSRQQSFSPSRIGSDSNTQMVNSSQHKGKGKVLTDDPVLFEEDDWCCSICQDILVGASVLGACGHEYCGKCIWEYIKAGNTHCAICRVKMTEPKAVVLYKLNELVEKWAEKTLRGKEKENWEIRKDEWLAYKFSLADEAAELASKTIQRAHQTHTLDDSGALYDNLYRNSYNLENEMIRRYQDEHSSDTILPHGNSFSIRSHHNFPLLGAPVSQRLPTNNFSASSASPLTLPISQRIPRANPGSSIPPSSWSDRLSQRRPSASGFIPTNFLHQPNTGTMPSRSHSSGSVWGIRPSAYTSSIGPHSSASPSLTGTTASSSSSSSSTARQPQSSRIVQPGSMSAPARRARSQATPDVVDLTAD